MDLQSRFVGFAGADAHGLFERRHEDLSVADLAGLGGGRACIDHLLSLLYDPRIAPGMTKAEVRAALPGVIAGRALASPDRPR